MTDAEILKTIRTQAGMTQMEMSGRTGIAISTISSVESESRPLSLVMVKALVEHMSVNPYFFHDQNQTTFLPGSNEVVALKKKIKEYEKLIDKLLEVKNAKE